MNLCVICDAPVEHNRLICSNHDAKFRYQFLDRLRCDCEFYLGYGNRRSEILWAHDVKRHIKLMKEVYGSFPMDEKPEWLPFEKILEYEAEMENGEEK